MPNGNYPAGVLAQQSSPVDPNVLRASSGQLAQMLLAGAMEGAGPRPQPQPRTAPDGAVIPPQIPVEKMPLASHTKVLIPDYEPAQWQMMRSDVGPQGAREQWERPIPEGTTETKFVDRPAGVSRQAYQNDAGQWVEPPAAVTIHATPTRPWWMAE